MNKITQYICITSSLFSMLLFTSVQAMAIPTSEMAKEVVDYYYYGQEQGPILTEAKLCKTVEALECVEELKLDSVLLGETVKVWMRFLVPKDATYDDIFVEYRYENMPWRIVPHKIVGSVRYRVVDQFKLSKPGKWTITIKKGISKLEEFTVNVVQE